MTTSDLDGRGLVLDALRRRPSGLLTDIDGTLSPVAPTPDAARVEPAARRALQSLLPRLDVIAAVTGRDPRQAARMLDLPGVVYVGNHGLEQLHDGEVRLAPEAEPFAGVVGPIFERVQSSVNIPGVIYEDKRVTGSVHFRQADDQEGARARLRAALEPLVVESGMELHDGRMILEVRPGESLGKGAAARRIVEERGLRGCVFLGDDTTDTDAFRELRALRADGRIVAVCVGVLSEETPPLVAELADTIVDGVPGVVALLNWLEENL